jgi:hypothetical protein
MLEVEPREVLVRPAQSSTVAAPTGTTAATAEQQDDKRQQDNQDNQDQDQQQPGGPGQPPAGGSTTNISSAVVKEALFSCLEVCTGIYTTVTCKLIALIETCLPSVAGPLDHLAAL